MWFLLAAPTHVPDNISFSLIFFSNCLTILNELEKMFNQFFFQICFFAKNKILKDKNLLSMLNKIFLTTDNYLLFTEKLKWFPNYSNNIFGFKFL